MFFVRSDFKTTIKGDGTSPCDRLDETVPDCLSESKDDTYDQEVLPEDLGE